MSREPQIQKFKITGMDCASCARKIEVAVGRVKGASDVKVGVTSETLTVTLAEALHAAEVTATVKSLGYGIAPVGGSAVAPAAKPAHQDDHDHSSCGGHHHDHAPVAKEPLVQKFKISGMDCASCARKIEVAVARIDGASDVKVGLTSETLTVTLATLERAADVTATVKSLGYSVAPLGASAAPAAKAPDTHDHDHGSCNGHAHDHDHGQPAVAAVAAAASPDDHAKPVDVSWWQSAKGRLVLISGALIAAAYAATQVIPEASYYVFLAACAAGAIPVVKRAFMAARYGSVFTIEMLMTIAVIGAIVIGATEEAALVVFLFAVGELLEGVAAGRARSGIKALANIAPKTAMVETRNGLVEMPIAQIAIGSIVVVRPGDRVPADGTVISGTSSLDESALTGESVPRVKEPGDTVLAGSINTEAMLRCRVEKPAEDTLIARVVRLVEEAADAKAPTERFIDTFSRYYMPAICAVAILVAILPPLVWGQDWSTWIYRALALLLIGCPCALVISTPAAIASALAAGARRGLLVKGGGVLEAIGKVKAIAFDKTGTLTEGKPKVTDIVPLADLDEAGVLKLAAAAESSSSHPLAAAIVAEAKARKIAFTPASHSEALPGKGLNATVDGQIVTIGAPARLGVTSVDVLTRARNLEAEGKSVSVVQSGGKVLGLIALRDEPRADAVAGLKDVASLGIRTVMLTGDNRANAEAIGKTLGMEVNAELLPEDKLAFIKKLAAEGGVAKVGDGINDAPALAAATVGIAMGSGTDVALEAADAAVLNNRVSDVAALVRLSRRTLSIIRENVTIALGLKAVFLVTTVMGTTGLWIAILADTGATVLVTANALRLLRSRSL
ncbi:cadmium-translocating P-type ATPase [Aestuariivirga sp. YIM B02566]|uniref:Cadmium-translocating P-type ATPase n=2 Tax=Taklimakanibacter albus TaxID=2800327 RepID=A0ACC5R694_9HYPH|nr:heavy metal translocating P-type ATPase [Aestuariivirga sp. YIM B02566]MBK1868083.1 cadmium-translocating P-type ATPase [Aestuariivirga sp. YIM B02566]